MDWLRMGDWGRRHRLPAFALAVLLAAAGITVRFVLGPALKGFPFLSFFPAIMIATLIGGRGPGAACAILSTLMAWYWLIDPTGSLRLIWPGGVIALALFAGIGALVVALIDGLVNAHTRARAHASAFERLNAELEARVLTRTSELTHEIEVREAAEEQVRQLQRLEAVGQLTGVSRMISIICSRSSWATSASPVARWRRAMPISDVTWMARMKARRARRRSPSACWRLPVASRSSPLSSTSTSSLPA
jgi:K+-sensing histidine kinase KdpD